MLGIIVSGCGKFNQVSQNMPGGLQVSQNMSDEEVEEESHAGQMRNIR